MGEYLTGECPHCSQRIEYPAEGTGQTVACPTCEESFVLKPVALPAAEVFVPVPVPAPNISAPPEPLPPLRPSPQPTASVPAAPASKPLAPFELACLEFERDAQFAQRRPTRDQVARAWAAVKMRAEHHSDIPKHSEVVTALKELFKEFRSSHSTSVRTRPLKPI